MDMDSNNNNNNNNGAETSTTREVQVVFVTKTCKKVAETPFAIPVTLTRYGLSEIINHLLNQAAHPTPFDFLINGEFLRTSIEKFLERRGLTTENILELEYVEAQPAPKSVESIPHDDWISSIATLPNGTIITGCYDGICRVMDPYKVSSDNNDFILATAAHPPGISVKHVGIVPYKLSREPNTPVSFLTTTKDEFIRLWKYTPGSKTCDLQLMLKGHSFSVECVDAVMPSSTTNSVFVATGGWDKTVRLWGWKMNDEGIYESSPGAAPSGTEGEAATAAAAAEDTTVSRKKRRLEGDKMIPVRAPLKTLRHHSLAVSAVLWGGSNSGNPTLFSASWDHTICLWDVNTGLVTRTFAGSQVTSSSGLSYQNASGLLLSGHPDKVIRLWDPRVSSTSTNSISQFRSHKGWVRCVDWSQKHGSQQQNDAKTPTRGDSFYQFVSASDDGTVKLWDIRSNTALHTIQHHDPSAAVLSKSGGESKAEKEPRAMAVAWAKNPVPQAEAPHFRHLFTGGTDCQVRRHIIKSL
eukprot:GEZU01014655.1.p1 GENE.GEZU01014655.1~~GEZU01014655.1.p1  ORF type:complete len:524 (-),score=126.52 GEZU01014655.1:167-1738(-)